MDNKEKRAEEWCREKRRKERENENVCVPFCKQTELSAVLFAFFLLSLRRRSLSPFIVGGRYES